MKVSLNLEQKKLLSSFFNSIAVAWFIGAFVVPKLSPEFDLLTLAKYIGNMIIALAIAVYLLKE